MNTPTSNQIGQPTRESATKYVLTVLSGIGRGGATIADLERLVGAPFGAGSPLGDALTDAVAVGTVEEAKGRFRVVAPPSREVTLLRPEVHRDVADIVSTHIPGAEPDDVASAAELIAHLQGYADDLMTTALGQYAPVVDRDGNHLFLHKTCAMQSWGTGNEPPERCRPCEMRTDAWTPVYVRSNVTVNRDRTPRFASEPALTAALRGAFDDFDLIEVALVLNADGGRVSKRLQEIIQQSIEGL